MTFEELVKISGDSTLEKVLFDGRTLHFELELADVDALVSVSVMTSVVQTNLSASSNKMLDTCFLNVVDLSTQLEQQNGYYLPPEDFAELMKHRKNGVCLAYGMKTDEAKFLVSAIGYSQLFSCIVKDLESIEVTT